MSAICTIATGTAIKDLKVFFFTLSQFNQVLPSLYIVCDSDVQAYIETEEPYGGPIHIKQTLNYAKNLTRQQMERKPGLIYKTLWEDFMMEKATVMDFAFNDGAESVFFFDSDICFMGPLPVMSADTKFKLGVCQHMILPRDEAKYGRFNAGYVWTSDKNLPTLWRKAAHSSYFYDQAALETVANNLIKEDPTAVYFFPVQNNYGWWRMFQATESVATLQSYWSIHRKPEDNSTGIRIENKPLLSIHTHWQTNDSVTKAFNLWTYSLLQKLGKYPHAAHLVKFLQKEFSYLR